MLDYLEKHDNGDQRQICAWNVMRKHWVNFKLSITAIAGIAESDSH